MFIPQNADNIQLQKILNGNIQFIDKRGRPVNSLTLMEKLALLQAQRWVLLRPFWRGLLLVCDQHAQLVYTGLQARGNRLVIGDSIDLQGQLHAVVDGHVLLQHAVDADPVLGLAIKCAQLPAAEEAPSKEANITRLILSFTYIEGPRSTELEQRADDEWLPLGVLFHIMFDVLRRLHQRDSLLSQAQRLGDGRVLEIAPLCLAVEFKEITLHDINVVEAQTRPLDLLRALEHHAQSVGLTRPADQPLPPVRLEDAMRHAQPRKEGDEVLPVFRRLHQGDQVHGFFLRRSRLGVHGPQEERLILANGHADGLFVQSVGVFLSEHQLPLRRAQPKRYKELFAEAVEGLVQFGGGRGGETGDCWRASVRKSNR